MPMVAQEDAVEYVTTYDPDVMAYGALQHSHSFIERSRKLPEGFPERVTDCAAWLPQQLGSSYVFSLLEYRDEIALAARNFIASGQPLSSINQATFPLPSLSRELANKRRQLHGGCGVVLFRGLDPDKFTRLENVVIFTGLSSHMSGKRGYQAAGKILVHIRDLSSIAPGSLSVAPYTNIKLPFHTDYGDVLSMFVLGISSQGGNGLLSPVASIYNDIAASRPDLIGILSTPDWPFDRPVGGDLYERRAVLHLVEGKPEMIFSRGGLLRSKASQRLSVMPELTSAQAEALDTVHFTSQKYSLNVCWEKGDVLFFNNRKILHGRDAFSDSEDGSGARHFLRLWLQDEELAGPPPKSLEIRWKNLFQRRNNAEGHDAEAEEDRWPLEPISNGKEALSKRI